MVSYRNVLLARHAVRHFRSKKGTGTETRTAIVSSIVTGDVPVSYWPISNSPRSLFESQLGPVSSFLKCRISKERLHSSSLIVTGDVPVSYWPISNSPRSLFESQLGPVSSFLKCRISKERLHSSSLAIFCENTVKIENKVHTQNWKGLGLIVS